MDLWLARHGTTTANLEGRFQGWQDTALSTEGLREAAALAQRLARLPLDTIFSSDLQRARQTARFIARANGAPLKVTPLLRECRWGIIEGLTRVEAAARYPFLASRWSGGRRPAIPGAESKRLLIARCRLLFRCLESLYPPESVILLVSHGRFLNALLTTALGFPLRQSWPFMVHPASLSLLRRPVTAGGWRIELFNDRCHLAETLYPGSHLQ